MKSIAEKILSWLLLLTGGLRLVYERFPYRLEGLRVLGGDHYGWIFWILGIAGMVWMVLRAVPDSEETEKSFFQKYGIEILILLITAASLSMLIHSGYYWDDAVNSTHYLAERKDSVPLLTHVLDFMKEYLKLGRINVLSIYYYFFFYIENVSVYKALIILMILGNQLIFRRVLMEFGVPLSGARIGMLLIPMLLQTRAYQDPVSGFYGLMQVLLAELLLCVYFLSKWTRTGRKKDVILSVVFFTCGLLTYEVCFPFILMICLLLWVRRGNFREAARDAVPFVLVVALLLGGVWFVRNHTMSRNYAGVAFSLNPERILRAAIRQVTAGLPLSYYSAGYWAAVMNQVYPAVDFMNYDFISMLKAVQASDLLILVIACWCFSKIRKSAREDTDGWKSGELAVLGFSFALLPSVTVAMSDRYQGQLMAGLGYLPVYLQYYGIAILLVWLILLLRRNGRVSTGIRAVGLSAYLVILLLNLQNNRAVTEIMNRMFYYPRNAGEASLHGGILDFLPEDAVLISANDRTYLWEADWNNRGLYSEFYSNHSRHMPETVGDMKALREMVDAALTGGAVPDGDGFISFESDDIWLIHYYGEQEWGFARLGRLRSADVNVQDLTLRGAETDTVLYFISGNAPELTEIQYTTADGEFRRIGWNEQNRVRKTGDGILFALPEDERIVFDSIARNYVLR